MRGNKRASFSIVSTGEFYSSTEYFLLSDSNLTIIPQTMPVKCPVNGSWNCEACGAEMCLFLCVPVLPDEFIGSAREG